MKRTGSLMRSHRHGADGSPRSCDQFLQDEGLPAV